ncbi:MAG: arylmalonate decarboxylase [Rhodospirillaceae bacterium]|nr:arylmalonate decarboxylase [Rhodospirillaceae bacterium]|tara:strand:- start:8137 stop:8913 length:777 start_codon:yes stop_codon:yes gene_type:complete
MAAVPEQANSWPLSTPRETRLGRGRHTRGRLGFVLLSSEETADDDIRTIVPDDVGVFYTRVPLADPVTIETLAAVGSDLTRAASILPPEMDAIAYVCTSGSVVVGENEVARALAEGQPGAKTTSLVTCAVEAMHALGMQKIVLGTPYLDEVNHFEADFLVDRGFDVLDVQGLCLETGQMMCMVEPEDIVKLALEIDRPDADGIFISCSALRTVEVVEEIEQKTGKPCVGSNHSLIWRMMRLAGIDDHIEGLGRLYREH